MTGSWSGLENQGKVLLRTFQREAPKPRQYALVTREQRIRKVGGLKGRYAYYCYKLGYLPKYQKQSPTKVHYLLREMT